MHKRSLSIQAASLLALSVPVLSVSTAIAAPSPNIVWIVAEDLSPLVEPYAFGQVNTPHINGLAGEGITFDNAFAPAPVCAPARFALITGRHAAAHPGAEGMRSYHDLDESIKFFPEFLRNNGYYTANWGKTDYNAGSYRGGDTDLALQGAWDETKFIWAPLGDNAPERGPHWRHRPDPAMPFFQMFNIVSTHENFLFPDLRHEQPRHDPAMVVLPPYHEDTPLVRTDWAFLSDRIEEMDAQVGGIIKDLEEDGELDDTIIFWFADHGGNLIRTKRYLRESGLRVPLIIWFGKNYRHLAPSATDGRSDQLVSFVDFAPSVLNLLGLKIPDYMQGQPFLGDHLPEPRSLAYVHRQRIGGHIDLVRGVTDGRYLYLRNYLPRHPLGPPGSYQRNIPSLAEWSQHYGKTDLPPHQREGLESKPFEQLYDTLYDRDNLYNMSENPAYQAVLQRMQRGFDEQMQASGDIGLYWTYSPDVAPFSEVKQAADTAASATPENVDSILKLMHSANPVIRFWGLQGAAEIADQSPALTDTLREMLTHPDPYLRLIAAEAMASQGHAEEVLPVFRDALEQYEGAQPTPALWALNAISRLGIDGFEPLLPQIEEMSHFDKGAQKHEQDWAQTIIDLL